jgi:hypothetical protein
MKDEDIYKITRLNDEQKKDLEFYLLELVDYLKDRMDADYDDGQMIANEEMKMLYNLENIFGLHRY